MDGWVAWVMANPEGAAALASAVTAVATLGLVAVGLLIGGGQIAVVWWGIRKMARSGEAREREHERRHEEALRESNRRHEEALRESDRRHEEALRESADRHKESMEALKVLIERTASPAASK